MKQRGGFARSIIHENLSEEKYRRRHRDKRNKQQHHHRYRKGRGVLDVGFFFPLHRTDKHDPDEDKGHRGNHD